MRVCFDLWSYWLVCSRRSDCWDMIGFGCARYVLVYVFGVFVVWMLCLFYL